MKKNKNKAIAGRRNRCHRMGPIFIYRDEYDESTYQNIRKQLEAAANDSRGFEFMLLKGNIEVHFPNQSKKPRFIL